MGNQNSYFIIDVRILSVERENDVYKEKIINSVDLILASMGVEEKFQEFTHKEGSQKLFLFRTNKRKRKRQLVKFCTRYLTLTK